MHIPDGFLDARTAALTIGFAALGLGLALCQARRTLRPKSVPLIGLASAFVFAAQMLNFPVAGGTSGHLIGAVLVTVLLGLSAAVIVLSSVLILQCLIFADGGLTALGANIFLMAMVAPGVGYAVYLFVSGILKESLRGRLLATAFAAWCSTVVASIACAALLSLSATVKWQLAFPAMVGVHMLIGIGEALITTLSVAALWRLRPDLSLSSQQTSPAAYKTLLSYGFLLSLGLVLFVAPFASEWPDGLEHVAGTLGFENKALTEGVLASPLPDYSVPGLDSATASTIIAGLIGTVIAFGLSYILARALTTKESEF